MIRRLILFMTVVACIELSAQWNYVGPAGISNQWTTDSRIALDTAGLPVVAYHQGTIDCKRFDGTQWLTLDTNIVNFPVNRIFQVLIDQNNGVYLITTNPNNGFASCLYHNGAAWSYLGQQYIDTTESVNYVSADFDTSGVLYCAMRLGTQGFRYFKLDSGVWQPVATTGMQNYATNLNLRFNKSNNKAFLAFAGVTGYANCRELNGTTWTAVGNANFFTPNIYNLYFAITGDGNMYIACDNSSSVDCFHLDTITNTWTSTGFSFPSSGNFGISDLTGSPAGGNVFMALPAWANDKGRCFKYDGNAWTQLGSNGMSDSTVSYPNLAVSDDEKVYAAYQDHLIGKTVVKVFDLTVSSNNPVETEAFHVYPNPASELLYVESVELNGKAEAMIVDVIGRVVMRSNVSGSSAVNVSSLAPGVYYLHYSNGDSVQIISFAKM